MRIWGFELNVQIDLEIEQAMIQTGLIQDQHLLLKSSVYGSGQTRKRIPGFLLVSDQEILEGFVNTDLGSRIIPMPRLESPG